MTQQKLEAENAMLRERIIELEARLAGLGQNGADGMKAGASSEPSTAQTFGAAQLTKDQVERYSRQSLLEDFRPQGTRRLLDGSVLIVGAGGLGSTVALFLAAAGVGKLRIVDFDVVERSNLHRQVIHNDYRVGMPKAISARLSCLALNPTIVVEAVCERFEARNAETLLQGCDVVVDASDNVAARYVINDACAFARKPLVSGSAMRWEGQLTVYNYTDPVSGVRSPCYRCLFPQPPPAAAVGSCNDTGVVGAAPGCIGVLQALEVQKILIGTRGGAMNGRMLIFDGFRGTYRVVRLRPQQQNCVVCSEARRFTSLSEAAASGSFPEYDAASCAAPKQLPSNAQAMPEELHRAIASGERTAPDSVPAVILDVRERVQYELCALPNSVNYPLHELKQDVASVATSSSPERARAVQQLIMQRIGCQSANAQPPQVFVICRRGVASSDAVDLLLHELQALENDSSSAPGALESPLVLRNVSRGLNAWAQAVDTNFPEY